MRCWRPIGRVSFWRIAATAAKLAISADLTASTARTFGLGLGTWGSRFPARPHGKHHRDRLNRHHGDQTEIHDIASEGKPVQSVFPSNNPGFDSYRGGLSSFYRKLSRKVQGRFAQASCRFLNSTSAEEVRHHAGSFNRRWKETQTHSLAVFCGANAGRQCSQPGRSGGFWRRSRFSGELIVGTSEVRLALD